MQTVLQIVKRAGGFRPDLYLKIDHAPYMEIVIEALWEPGPLGLPCISVAHYGEQNGDAMRDPEMCFELVTAEDGTLSLDPWYWRNDYVSVEQWSRNLLDGKYVRLAELYKQHDLFAQMWDNNLRQQGFADIFDTRHIQG